jgi:hypothetical protein
VLTHSAGTRHTSAQCRASACSRNPKTGTGLPSSQEELHALETFVLRVFDHPRSSEVTDAA